MGVFCCPLSGRMPVRADHQEDNCHVIGKNTPRRRHRCRTRSRIGQSLATGGRFRRGCRGRREPASGRLAGAIALDARVRVKPASEVPQGRRPEYRLAIRPYPKHLEQIGQLRDGTPIRDPSNPSGGRTGLAAGIRASHAGRRAHALLSWPRSVTRRRHASPRSTTTARWPWWGLTRIIPRKSGAG